MIYEFFGIYRKFFDSTIIVRRLSVLAVMKLLSSAAEIFFQLLTLRVDKTGTA